MKSKKFFNSPWTIAIFAPIITLVLMKVFDLITGTKILEWFINLLVSMFQGIRGFFTEEFSWKLYQLILLFISGPIIGIVILWIISKLQSDEEVEKVLPEWFKYTRDSFDNINYRWQWEKGIDGKYQISNISAHCPNCDCKIIHGSCPNCHNSLYMGVKEDYEIATLIHHRIEIRNMK